MKFEAVIGLEVHSQLKTKTKLFSSSNNEFGEDPNANVSVVDLGLPGALPVINDKAVDLAILAGLSTDCKINKKSTFARKHYFYPDLPKGYQISQYDEPLASDGVIIIPDIQGIDKKIRINRIHMEEDAGKLIHDISDSYSMVDLNRAGVPLIEIVSEPDISSADEAVSYLKKLRSILIYANVSDCNMEEGNFRCDANISIRQLGEKELGVKAEIKNINSFKFVKKAIEYEIDRQSKILSKGDKVVQETRLFNSNLNKTFSMRSKEDAHDYRYFPDPDLKPLILSDERIDVLRNQSLESYNNKIELYTKDYKLSKDDSEVLLSSKELSKYFEDTLEVIFEPKLASKWIITEIIKYIGLSSFVLEVVNFAQFLKVMKDGKINNNSGKDLLAKLASSNDDVNSLIESMDLVQESSEDLLSSIIDQVLDDNPDEAKRLLNGEVKLVSFFMGQVMKETKGKGNPGVVSSIIKKKFKIRASDLRTFSIISFLTSFILSFEGFFSTVYWRGSPNFKITFAGLINFVFLGKASKVPLIAKGTIGDPDLSAMIATPSLAWPIFPSLERWPSGNKPHKFSFFNSFITFKSATLSLVALFTGIQFPKSHRNLKRKFLLYTSSAARKFIFLLV